MTARLLGAVAVLGGFAVDQAQGFLDTCADSPHLRKAIQAAGEGDLHGTRVALLGSTASGNAFGLYDELVHRGFPWAALDFEVAMTEVFEGIRADSNAPIGDSDE